LTLEEKQKLDELMKHQTSSNFEMFASKLKKELESATHDELIARLQACLWRAWGAGSKIRIGDTLYFKKGAKNSTEVIL